MGARGLIGCVFMVILDDSMDTQVPLDTVNVNTPASRPLKDPVVPVPITIALPLAVTVQLPLVGNPLNATVPVGVVQFG